MKGGLSTHLEMHSGEKSNRGCTVEKNQKGGLHSTAVEKSQTGEAQRRKVKRGKHSSGEKSNRGMHSGEKSKGGIAQWRKVKQEMHNCTHFLFLHVRVRVHSALSRRNRKYLHVIQVFLSSKRKQSTQMLDCSVLCQDFLPKAELGAFS